MSTALGTLTIDFVAEMASFKRDMATAATTVQATARNIETHAKSAASSIRNIGLAAAGSIAAYVSLNAAVNQISGLISTNTQYERLKSALETVEGSASKAASTMNRLKDFAARTPYELEQSIQAYTKLKMLGMDPSEKSMTAFGNTAAAMGKDLIQFIEAVADASTNEFERLKEFGIKAKQTTDTVTFTFQGQATTVKKNAQDIADYLTKIGNTTFAGAMDRMMAGLPGKIANLQDPVTNLKTAIGEGGFNRAVGDAAASLSTFVDSLVKSGAAKQMGENLGETIRTITKAGIDFTNAYGTSFTESINNATTGISKMIEELTSPQAREGFGYLLNAASWVAGKGYDVVAGISSAAGWAVAKFDEDEYNRQNRNLGRYQVRPPSASSANRSLRAGSIDGLFRNSELGIDGLFGNSSLGRGGANYSGPDYLLNSADYTPVAGALSGGGARSTSTSHALSKTDTEKLKRDLAEKVAAIKSAQSEISTALRDSENKMELSTLTGIDQRMAALRQETEITVQELFDRNQEFLRLQGVSDAQKKQATFDTAETIRNIQAAADNELMGMAIEKRNKELEDIKEQAEKKAAAEAKAIADAREKIMRSGTVKQGMGLYFSDLSKEMGANAQFGIKLGEDIERSFSGLISDSIIDGVTNRGAKLVDVVKNFGKNLISAFADIFAQMAARKIMMSIGSLFSGGSGIGSATSGGSILGGAPDGGVYGKTVKQTSQTPMIVNQFQNPVFWNQEHFQNTVQATTRATIQSDYDNDGAMRKMVLGMYE